MGLFPALKLDVPGTVKNSTLYNRTTPLLQAGITGFIGQG